MSGLTSEDRDALIDAVLDDAARKDGFTVLGPGGADGNTPTLNEAVEQIVARHVAEALEAVAEQVEHESAMGGIDYAAKAQFYSGLNRAARIVRAAIPQTSPLPEVGLSPPGS